MFMSNARQSEVDLVFAILGRDFDHFFGRIVSVREETLRNLLLLASGHIKREKDLLLVDIRRLKKLTNVVPACLSPLAPLQQKLPVYL